MLKRKKNPFFVALNEMSFDLKKIIKFNINTQSLEISSFSKNEKDKLNVFYQDGKIVVSYKGNCERFTNPSIQEKNYESYKIKYERLLINFKNKILKKKNDAENKNKFGYTDHVREYMDYNFYELNDKEKIEFEKLVEKELIDKNIDIDTSLSIADKDSRINIVLCSYSMQKYTDIISFYNIVDRSRLSYSADEFVKSGHDEINISSFISHHKELSIDLKIILRKFIDYRVVKSMPRKYFNL
jgi:hypothetical protein